MSDSKDTSKYKGRKGEQIAKNHLLRRNYLLLAQNFHGKRGEIDLICQKKDTIVFIEVKTNMGNKRTEPYERVDRKKILKLKTAAQLYLSTFKKRDYLVRFDIISIKLDSKGRYKNLRHIKHIDV